MILKMMQLQCCCMFFFTSVVACSLVQQIAHLNATFPCGKLVDEQKCKIPFEYCDVILESCQPCNEDICNEKSQQSCNIYCSNDFKKENSKIHVHTETQKSLYKTPFYFSSAFAFVFLLTATICLFYICYKRSSVKKRNGTDIHNTVRPISMIAQPTDDNNP